jgi:hypothetical protein
MQKKRKSKRGSPKSVLRLPDLDDISPSRQDIRRRNRMPASSTVCLQTNPMLAERGAVRHTG